MKDLPSRDGRSDRTRKTHNDSMDVARLGIYQCGAQHDWQEHQEAGSMIAPAIAPFSFGDLPEALASLENGSHGGKLIAQL